MNRRQRKKKDTKGLTLIFSCEMVCKQETYANLEQTIQAQLNKGNVIVLPPYLRLEGTDIKTEERRAETWRQTTQ